MACDAFVARDDPQQSRLAERHPGYEQLTPLQRERLYRHGPFGRR